MVAIGTTRPDALGARVFPLIAPKKLNTKKAYAKDRFLAQYPRLPGERRLIMLGGRPAPAPAVAAKRLPGKSAARSTQDDGAAARGSRMLMVRTYKRFQQNQIVLRKRTLQDGT